MDDAAPCRADCGIGGRLTSAREKEDGMRTNLLVAALSAVLLPAAAPAFTDKPPGPWTARNMRVVGYSEVNRRPPFKLAIQQVDGRWLLYMGHLWDRGWTIMDVTNPRDPSVVSFIPGPANTWTIQMDVEEGKMN